jgi:uncharacterized membrane protein
MDKEEERELRERKLQIDLAKIQADIQVWLGWLLGCFAVAGAFLIAAVQLIISKSPIFYIYLSYGGTFAFTVLGIVYADKLDKARKKMDKLT